MKVDLTESERLEKEYYERMNREYEKVGKKLVGKFYKRKYIDQWKEEQIDFLYIYNCKGRSLSGIEFHDIMVNRVGQTVKYFNEGWEEIVDEEESKKIRLGLINLFHFDEIFAGVV